MIDIRCPVVRLKPDKYLSTGPAEIPPQLAKYQRLSICMTGIDEDGGDNSLHIVPISQAVRPRHYQYQCWVSHKPAPRIQILGSFFQIRISNMSPFNCLSRGLKEKYGILYINCNCPHAVRSHKRRDKIERRINKY